jgi:F-type H+-transporting ATPase subunit delta
MNESKISVRYSRALFLSALDKNNLDNIYRDMILMSEISTIGEFKELINSPIIKPSRKAKIFHNTLDKIVDPLTLSLIDLVIKNGRENYLPAIARVFLSQTKEYKGITETVMTTAVKVDEGIKQQISAFIADAFKTKVELKEIVDNDIIGGFVLRIEDKYIDASIRTKLNKIKKELLAKTLTD